MLHSIILLSICVVAALVLGTEGAPAQGDISNERSSPCPSLFRYDSLNEPGQWTGNLVLQPDDDLYGVWARVIFDNAVKKVSVDGDYEAIPPNDKNEVLIKNRDVLLKAGSVTNLKITIKYDGAVPNLVGYRLNAKVICPEPNTKRTDFFQGDANSKDFLTTVLSNIKPVNFQTTYKCGIKPSTSAVYPWQAAILIKQNNKEHYVCEGTLISPSHVLTSAHCVTFENENTELSIDSLLVRLAGTEEVTVKEVNVHGGYDPSTLSNDVAVLELSTVLPINDNVRPICLSEKPSRGGSSALTGYSIERGGKIGSQLAAASVEKLDASSCAKRAPGLENILGDDTYCVLYLPDNQDCVGDSGSSLVSLDDNVATLRGVVTVGIILQNQNECNPNSPVVVTDISKHLKWIHQALN